MFTKHSSNSQTSLPQGTKLVKTNAENPDGVCSYLMEYCKTIYRAGNIDGNILLVHLEDAPTTDRGSTFKKGTHP